RMQNILSATTRLLVDGGQGQYTLAELPLVFVPTYQSGKKGAQSQEIYNPFVKSLLQHTRHPGTLSFWEEQWATWTSQARREWVQSTEGRISQYLSDERLSLSICSIENSTLDFRRVVDQGLWVFCNLPYPLLSDTITTLLGNLIITNIFYACMQRSPGSRPYRLIVDESKFYTNGALDIILETAQAYNLRLTLIVQSLDQLSRSREGRVDERVRDTAINNCRYITAFHNVADAKLLADIMFPITGRVVTGIRTNDDLEYQPVFGEQNEHEWRFKNLRHREMIFYDQLGQEPPQVWRTPDVIMDPPDEARIQAFEARHLRATGRPIEAIRGEMRKRRGKVKALFSFIKPPEDKGPSGESESGVRERKLNKASYGEWE
ncbi:MAG: type IV secretory system conjugative DNA transfer family protein, partial [Armatimonadota bacterium]